MWLNRVNEPSNEPGFNPFGNTLLPSEILCSVCSTSQRLSFPVHAFRTVDDGYATESGIYFMQDMYFAIRSDLDGSTILVIEHPLHEHLPSTTFVCPSCLEAHVLSALKILSQ